MTRQKRSRELTKDDWDAAIDSVKLFCNLERPEFRKEVEELARELEREGLAAHRAADRLEGLTLGARRVRPSDHTRNAILVRLGRRYTPQHLHVPERHLKRLAETGLHGPGQLRQQASRILDAAEFIGTSMRYYAEFVAERRPSGRGPRPSLAMNTVETMMIDWGVGPTEMASHLAGKGIHLTVESLKMRLSRRRQRERRRSE